jgi:Protein of unknown function (DUF1657)
VTVGSQVKQTAASLKGVKATLDLYAATSVTEEDQWLFKTNSQKIDKVIYMLEKRISELEFEEPQYKGF